MAGRMGGKLKLIQGLKVMKVDPIRSLLLLRGSIPGCNNTILRIQDSFFKAD